MKLIAFVQSLSTFDQMFKIGSLHNIPNLSTLSGIEETKCLHFQECDDIPSAYSA